MERKPIYIMRNDTKEIIDLFGCVNIYTFNQGNSIYPYRISIQYGMIENNREITLTFENEKHRNNFHEHIITELKPTPCDVEEKPLKL